MSRQNKITLKSYEEHAQEYVATVLPMLNDGSKEWIDWVLSRTPTNGKILEVGSCNGVAAKYIESKGYKVITSDAVQSFVDILRNEGHEARLINVLTDELGSDYDLIIADAVLLHFTPAEVRKVLSKTLASLKKNGMFAFSVKQGSGSEWSEAKINAPRYMHYWESPELEAMVTQAGFKVVRVSAAGSRSAQWLCVVAKKP